MTAVQDVLRYYPLLSVALVLFPLIGGVVGAYVGFDNLSSRLAREQQQQKFDARQDAIRSQIDSLSIPVETLQHYEQVLKAQGESFDLLRQVLLQYNQLKSAVATHEKSIGKEDPQGRIATAEHILGELRAVLGVTQTVPGPGGPSLIIKMAPNTFRVTFAVPMRIVPSLEFLNLPQGTEGHVIEKSKIGFTVIFAPSDVAVDKFGFIANAEI